MWRGIFLGICGAFDNTKVAGYSCTECLSHNQVDCAVRLRTVVKDGFQKWNSAVLGRGI